MKLAVVVMAGMLAGVGAAAAAEDKARRPDPGDASRRLAEAVRTGTFDAADAAAIIGWVLNEREENVARGFLDALHAADLAGSGRHAERWNASARAMVALFERALADAASGRPSDWTGWSELADLVGAAAPAAAAALSEADPAAREQILRVLPAAVPAREAMPWLRQALRHEQPEVRQGAATLLGAMGAAARAAVPELTVALGDDDAAVRDAAARALKQIEK